MVVRDLGTKPENPVLNQDHWRARDLVMCFPYQDKGGTVVRDISGHGNHGTEITAGTPVKGRFGSARSWVDGVRHLDIKQSDLVGLPTAETTVFMLYEKNDATNRNSSLFGHQTTSSTLQFSCFAPRANARFEFNFGGFVVGTSRLRLFGLSFVGLNMWAFSAGPRGMDAWKNGVIQGSQVGHATRTVTSSFNFRVGSGGTFLGDNVTDHFFAIFNKQFSPTEIIEFSAHPFELIQDEERKKYFVPTVAVSPGTFLRRYEGQPAPNPLLRM